MANVQLDLQAGFSGHPIDVRLNGNEMLRATSVSTDYSIGLAATLRFTIEDGTHQLELTSEALSISEQHELSGHAYFVVNREDDHLSLERIQEPPTYF